MAQHVRHFPPHQCTGPPFFASVRSDSPLFAPKKSPVVLPFANLPFAIQSASRFTIPASTVIYTYLHLSTQKISPSGLTSGYFAVLLLAATVPSRPLLRHQTASIGSKRHQTAPIINFNKNMEDQSSSGPQNQKIQDISIHPVAAQSAVVGCGSLW